MWSDALCALGTSTGADGWIERRFFAALELVSNGSNSARPIPLGPKGCIDEHSLDLRSAVISKQQRAASDGSLIESQDEKANLGFRLCVHIDLMVALGG